MYVKHSGESLCKCLRRVESEVCFSISNSTSNIWICSALSHEDRKPEAAKYLRRAVAFNPSFKVYLEELENDDNFSSDLVNSRRGDY